MAFPDNTTLLDDFNRADGTLNGSSMSGGGSWAATQIGGATNWTIDTNAAAGPDLDAWRGVRSTENYDTAVGEIQFYTEHRGAMSDNDKGLAICVSSDGDAYVLIVRGEGVNDWELLRMDNASPTSIGSGALGFAPAAGDLFGLRMLANGDIHIQAKDGAGAWQDLDTVNDTTYTAGGVGFFSFGFNASLDGITNLWGGEYAPTPVYEQASYRFFDDGDELPHFDPGTLPTITSATGTTDAVNGTTVTASYPATVAPGDLIIWVVAKDDDAGPIVDTTTGLIPIAEGNGGSGIDGVRLGVWYEIADGDEDGGTRVFTSDSEMYQVFAIRILSAEYDHADPIGTVATMTGASSGTTANTGAFTPDRSNSLLIACGAVDADPMDATFSPSGWTDVADVDATDVTGWVARRDAGSTASVEVTAAAFGINADDAWAAVAFEVHAPLVADGRTPIDAVDTPVTLEVDAAYGVSIRVENSGGAGDDDFKWQYNHESGGWTDITAASSVVQTLATGDFADGDDVPEYIGGAGTYITNNNAAEESTGTFTLAAVMASGGAFESHLNFQIIGADVADEDGILLRLVAVNDGDLDTYTATPTITVNKEGGAVEVPLAGSLPAMSGALAVEQHLERAVAGSLPSQSGALTKVQSLHRSVAGSLPSQSGALTKKYKIALAGALPAASGALTFALFYEVALAGSLPSQSGVLAVKYKIALAGSLPSQSGVLDAFDNAGDVAGNLPAQTGALSVKYLIALAGALPAQSGALAALDNVIPLAGSLPAQSGSLSAKYLIDLAGSLPAMSATLEAFDNTGSLAGNLPSQSGALSIKYFIDLAGALPAQSGGISSEALTGVHLFGNLPSQSGALAVLQALARAVAGALPSQSSTLSVKYLIDLTGSLPAQTGEVESAVLTGVQLSGALPAMSGALTAQQSLARSLAGSLLSQSGSLTAQQLLAVALAGSLPAMSGTLAVASAGLVSLAGDLPGMSGTLVATVSVFTPPASLTGRTRVPARRVVSTVARRNPAAPLRRRQVHTPAR